MKLPHCYEVWRVMTEFPSKIPTDHALLEVTDGAGTLVATDGRTLVVLPVEVDKEDTGGLIPGDALGMQETKDPEEFPRQRMLTVRDGAAALPADPVGEFPDWRKVLPAPDGHAIEVRLNPKLLYDLARAMACQEHEALTLKIPAARDGQVREAIRVERSGSFVVGAIMPAVWIPDAGGAT